MAGLPFVVMRVSEVICRTRLALSSSVMVIAILSVAATLASKVDGLSSLFFLAGLAGFSLGGVAGVLVSWARAVVAPNATRRARRGSVLNSLVINWKSSSRVPAGIVSQAAKAASP